MEVIKFTVNMEDVLTEVYGAENAKKMMAAGKVEKEIQDNISQYYDGEVEVWVDPDDHKRSELYFGGDWKHAHVRMDNIMKHFGWECIGEEEDECAESCGDWYYATHIYKKVA